MKKTAIVVALAIVGATLTLSASPAHAWWDYAKWGMTVPQLSKASAGRLRECAGDCPGTFTGFRPTHRVDIDVIGFPGFAMFAFDDAGRLNWTVLRIPGGNSFNSLQRALAGVYGAPIERSGGSFPSTTWRDTTKKSSIRLIEIGNTSAIEYKPAASGL